MIPGKSEESRLYLMLTGRVEPRMPMGGDALPEEQIAAIKKWIDEGAAAPEQNSEAAILKPEERKLPQIKPSVPVKAQIFSLAYSPDGQTLALGGYQQVSLADAATGKVLRTLPDVSQIVRAVAFSADGAMLAAGSGPPGQRGEAKIWNLASGELLRTIEGHDDTIYAVAFSPDGQTLATSSYDKMIKLWDVASGQELRTLKDHIDAVYALAFTTDGKFLLSGSADRSVKVWEPASGKRLYTLNEPLDGINSIAVHPSGGRVAAGGLDRTIRVWKLSAAGGELEHSLIAHQAPILRLAYSPDGKTLVSASADNTIKIFQADTLTEVATIPNQSDWVMALQFAPDGKHFAAGRFDGSLSVYETSNFKDRLQVLSATR